MPYVDSFTTTAIRVWLVYDPLDGITRMDVDDTIGEPPDWFDLEVTETGWEYLLGLDSSRPMKILTWGLNEGIAPGQPFLVDVSFPFYSRVWTDLGYEYDVEVTVEVVDRARCAPADPSAAFERAVAEVVGEEAAAVRAAAERDHLLRHNLEHMQLCGYVYFAANQSTYDDMEMPAGYGWALESRHPAGFWVPIEHGRDDGGSREAALDDLVVRAARTLPHLTPTFIRALPSTYRF